MIVTSGAARLAVDVTGAPDGAPVLMLHAGVCDRRSWAGLAEALGPGARCIAPDRRGFGRTTYAPEPHADLDDTVAVLDALGVGRAAVVGASMGGRLALDLALAHPDRVSALVLIGPGVRGAPVLVPDSPAIEALDRAIEAAEEAGDLDAVNRLEAQVWLDGPHAPAGRVTGPARDLFLDMNGIALAAADPGPRAELPDAWDRLGDVAVPTLVVVGDLDVPDDVARADAIGGRVPGATVVHLAGTAHLPHLEPHPDCLPTIVSFLDALPGRVTR
jgi:pimeloyl-ACP methyl ester carboxylesterase